ncbi:hypothetical protein [Nocardia brasiliensis]|uniref:hypothetical protein n=1 Tax=Nocardia brasiliensis TaxID=37326 RepID=UPI002454C0E2|nr:hypothetical protein [Nocardia brasiliensis]
MSGAADVNRSGNDRVIPGKYLLLAALRGFPHADHPMLEAAGELAQLHLARERTPAAESMKIERRRIQLVRTIDRWVTLATPVPELAAVEHPETVGRLVDRLAELTAQASTALTYAPEPVFYDAWVRIEALAAGYQQLVEDLRHGIRRLPDDPYDDR